MSDIGLSSMNSAWGDASNAILSVCFHKGLSGMPLWIQALGNHRTIHKCHVRISSILRRGANRTPFCSRTYLPRV